MRGRAPRAIASRAIASLCVIMAAATAAAQAAPPVPVARADASRLDYGLVPHALAPNVWVVAGPAEDFSRANGCNIINTGFIVTDAGVVVINTGPTRRYGEQLRAAIARLTPAPVVRVLNLNQHPDYFFGNQAFERGTLAATERTLAGIQAEGRAYEANLYRLCGDWARDTELTPPAPMLRPGPLRVGTRELDLIELDGHTGSDLVVVDKASGVVFAGGLVFVDRAPTTPHADLPRWLASLERLAGLRFRAMVPSHGRVVTDATGIRQTAAYLKWLDTRFREAAASGADMIEVLEMPLPAQFAAMAAIDTEYVRNVTHLFPRYERAVLQRR
jgi:quinoprotein relay system zinc metallohydrolase 1